MPNLMNRHIYMGMSVSKSVCTSVLLQEGRMCIY